MTTMMDMGRIRVRLPVVMAQHRIKQRQLAEAAGLRPATINALYNDQAKGIQWDTLAQILDGLRKLTGQHYAIGELLEYVDDDPKQEN